jgi:hypothetical protein
MPRILEGVFNHVPLGQDTPPADSGYVGAETPTDIPSQAPAAVPSAAPSNTGTLLVTVLGLALLGWWLFDKLRDSGDDDDDQ